MDHEVRLWRMVIFHGPTLMVWSLEKKQFTKPLDSSLCGNQMWTKRHDHAPKSECLDFFNRCLKKKDNFNKIKIKSRLTISLPSLVFVIFFFTKLKKKVLCHRPLPFYFLLFLLEHLFCLSHRKICWTVSVDNVSLKIRILETSNSMTTLTFIFSLV